ncbi:TasA family protein [Chloroflexota bacterium]
MKKILGLTVVALMVMGLIGSGTWAYFSDVETSTGNTLAAGTLDLTVDDNDDPSIVAISVSDIAPGAAAANNVWVIKNVGNISGNFTLTVSAITDGEGDNPESENNTSGDGELSAQLLSILFVDVDGDGTFEGGDTELYGNGSGGMAVLSGLPATYDPTDPGLSGATPVNITLGYQLPSSADNEVQGDNCTFNIQFDLAQIT